MQLGGGYAALQSNVNGKFVSASGGGASSLIASASSIGTDEKFYLIFNADGTIAMQANANGKFVTADSAGVNPLIASGSSIGTWQKFKWIAR